MRRPAPRAGWQSGHAAACKAVYAGSIPTSASKPCSEAPLSGPGDLSDRARIEARAECLAASHPGSKCVQDRALTQVRRASWPDSARHEHAHLGAVSAVVLSELGDEVALFEPDADEDVAGRTQREQQMTCRHHRYRPQAEYDAEIQRMAHVAIQE